MESKEVKNKNKRSMEGIVVSDKMDKTIVVQSVNRVKHARLGKFMTRRYKMYAHDQNNDAKIGDKVLIEEISRPLSKSKRWILKSVVEKVQ